MVSAVLNGEQDGFLILLLIHSSRIFFKKLVLYAKKIVNYWEEKMHLNYILSKSIYLTRKNPPAILGLLLN